MFSILNLFIQRFKENGTDSSIFNLLSYISIEYNINMTKRLN